MMISTENGHKGFMKLKIVIIFCGNRFILLQFLFVKIITKSSPLAASNATSWMGVIWGMVALSQISPPIHK